ncbi:phBC6A51 family helix-turn-helix protein [Mangrovibacillus cuniculi]|uniref:Homeodomain phBC6A51-type domain-containing protein n=1 Tax=Mangrovibacillus cuniculi TaxID=2593652 RepID=A0A7S8HG09_9BACI|nr:phBC6A51 family helix-turn-helix protein [Mangrovibacillus cuniculi]QPC47363.1 hypothetical protein G8O30_10590 [Mangrovibacillus cuniculi]
MSFNNTEQKTEQHVNAIKPPASLSVQQVELAKKFVKAKMLEGFTVGGFCKENRLSTSTWYEWQESADFKKYMDEVQSAVIPSDERDAFQAMKKHILKLAYLQNPTPKQVELFMDTFEYVAEADKKERMKALGISDEAKGSDEKTIEEKRKRLLTRLKG